jgi:hypothetical protein
MTTLQRGDKGEQVKRLQRILKEHGFFKGEIGGNFQALTSQAVLYFQQTHLGPDGKFLEVDGVVGPDTWWALENPSGSHQRSNLTGKIPDGLTPKRIKTLQIALKEHETGVREIPDGSNGGGGVEKYLDGFKAPWCCYFWSWCTRQSLGSYPLQAKYGHCKSAWEKAKQLEMAREKGNYIPIPGDAFVMLYRNAAGKYNGKGHIGFVLRVQANGNGAAEINTVEGNCGNRVKVGRRSLASPEVVGFINSFPDDEQPTGWERGLIQAAAVAGDNTR